jgi:hypothetical protein
MLSKDDARPETRTAGFKAGLIKAIAVSKAVRAITRDAAPQSRANWNSVRADDGPTRPAPHRFSASLS